MFPDPFHLTHDGSDVALPRVVSTAPNTVRYHASVDGVDCLVEVQQTASKNSNRHFVRFTRTKLVGVNAVPEVLKTTFIFDRPANATTLQGDMIYIIRQLLDSLSDSILTKLLNGEA